MAFDKRSFVLSEMLQEGGMKVAHVLHTTKGRPDCPHCAESRPCGIHNWFIFPVNEEPEKHCKPCPDCKGTTWVNEGRGPGLAQTCPSCSGSGIVHQCHGDCGTWIAIDHPECLPCQMGTVLNPIQKDG